jgi:hypothetical protein
LYSWRFRGTWYFTLITGTNRLKTLDEISSPVNSQVGDWVKITVAGVPDLKALLGRLPPGTQVLWDLAHPIGPGSEGSQVRLRMPSRRRIREIRSHCTERGIRLEVGR